MDAKIYSNCQTSVSDVNFASDFRSSFSIRNVLSRPIAFHRCFVEISGSVTAARMLSQALYWQRVKRLDGWWWKTMEDWAEETGLSRKEQESARRKLRSANLLVEVRRGIPAKLYYQVNLAVLEQRLKSIPEPSSQIAPKGQTRMYETCLLYTSRCV